MPVALLIEDESTARADLRAKLAAHPDVTIVAEAATLKAGRALLARTDYDLVFLDIQLIGGSSFELVSAVRPGARVIFVTAYDTHAVRAFEVNALDYLLKPVTPARLAAALQRLGSAPALEAEPALGGPAGAGFKLEDTVYLRGGREARFVPVTDISGIAAQDNYSEVQLSDGTKLLIRKSLKTWEDALPASHFMRVHRTQIVNLARITRYERDADEHTVLHVQGLAEPVLASRSRWSELRDRLALIRAEP